MKTHLSSDLFVKDGLTIEANVLGNGCVAIHLYSDGIETVMTFFTESRGQADEFVNKLANAVAELSLDDTVLIPAAEPLTV